MMKNDFIVHRVRNNGLELAARCNNNIEKICKYLKEREKLSTEKTAIRIAHVFKEILPCPC